MTTGGSRGRRRIRDKVTSLLRLADLAAARSELRGLPRSRVIHALISLLFAREDPLRLRAAEMLGAVVSELALEDLEAARNVVRRLMWSVNDESGNIGWGATEAMAEILASHEGLCREYAPILVSYLREDGNFLGRGLLEPGLLRGIARLAEARPEVLRSLGAPRHLIPFLQSRDPASRDPAARALELLDGEAVRQTDNVTEDR